MAVVGLGGVKALASPHQELVVFAHLIGIPIAICGLQVSAWANLAAKAGADQLLRGCQHVEPFRATARLRCTLRRSTNGAGFCDHFDASGAI
jgi:hypothetical protein